MTDSDFPGGSSDEESPSLDAVYEEMDPLEPHTTSELAQALGAPRRLVRSLLNKLARGDDVQKKEPNSGRVVWVREPPAYECSNCRSEFRIKLSHPIFSSVRLCPTCGAQLE